MLKHVEVETFHKYLGDNQGGMSQPIQVTASDGEVYFLKNQNVYDPRISQWVDWNSMFLQEVLVHNIAKHLGILTPDCTAISVDQDFITHAPSLQFQHRITPGMYFGSKLINGVENNLKEGYRLLQQMKKPYIKVSWKNFFNKIENYQDVAKIVALDLLTANFDRFSNDGNLIIARQNSVRNVYVIDHGHTFFTPTWELQKQSLMHRASVQDQQYIQFIIQSYFDNNGGKPFGGLGTIFNAMEQHIDLTNPELHSFQQVVFEIEQINETHINSWFVGIPETWFVDKQNQILLYKKFLMQQKHIVYKLIDELFKLGAFQNITGGELSWKERKTGTQ
ncbi:hypothetical protein COF68_15535 [Bacillus toyonensis]|uniref:HipA family kinase n=1 Tax=Bacillus toyonensis TaxID=155322 RepID=UPI000BFCBDDE|nr:HipA family kinase [Bacillus toyonensis]PHE61840.1 hypothetical protein COF68_15535 [Bacillus toyonensis]